MPTRDPRDWMWADALDMVARAEKLHQRMFRPASGAAPNWEPPVDVLETPHEVVIVAALPGVPEASIKTAIEGSMLVISGERTAPEELTHAVIHRLELPQGCFERRIPLPAGRYDQVTRRQINGCLVINLRKAG